MIELAELEHTLDAVMLRVREGSLKTVEILEIIRGRDNYSSLAQIELTQ